MYKIKKYALTFMVVLTILVIIAFPVLAQTYYATITVLETSGNDYDMFSTSAPLDVTNLVDSNFIGSTGLDTRVMEGVNPLPHMLAEDRLLFADNLPSLSSQNYQFTVGSSNLTDFNIITGYGGYIWTADNDTDLELGDNFTITHEGWVTTTFTDNYSDRNLVYKEGACSTHITGSGAITSGVGENSSVVSFMVGDDFGQNFAGTDWEAMTFLTPSTFRLGQVGLKLYRVGTTPGQFDVSIRATVGGKPTGLGTDLTTGSLNANEFTDAVAGEWYYVDLTAITLDNATTYGIVCRAPTGNATDYVRWRYDNGGGYGDGGRNWSNDGGGTWTTVAASDYMFDVWEEVLEVTATGLESGDYEIKTTAENLTEHYEEGATSGTFHSNSWVAQTFSSNSTCNVTVDLVSLYLFRIGNPGDVVVSLRATLAGEPTGADLTTANITEATVSNTDWTWNYADLPNYTLACDTTYAIVVRAPDGGILNAYGFGRDSNGQYDNGSYYSSGDGGVNWSLSALLDMKFRVHNDLPILKLFVDGVEKDCAILVGSVIDNSANWTFMENNSMPYADNITISIDGTEQLRYEPVSIIEDDNLPDLSGATSQNGTFVWGANPVGVSVLMGSLTVYEDDAAAGAEPVLPGVVGEVSQPEGMFPSEDDLSGTNITWLYATIRDWATLTDTPIVFLWGMLCMSFIFFTFVAMFKYTQNTILSGVVMLLAIGVCVGMSLLPVWLIIIPLLIVIAFSVMERKPAI